jgi:hypothetical protein
MKSHKIFGVIVAAGLIATTAVRAQDNNAASGMNDTAASPKPQAQRPRYGQWVNGPATTDADGIPVAKPNPISREEDNGGLGGIDLIPGPLTDESNSSSSSQPPKSAPASTQAQ